MATAKDSPDKQGKDESDFDYFARRQETLSKNSADSTVTRHTTTDERGEKVAVYREELGAA